LTEICFVGSARAGSLPNPGRSTEALIHFLSCLLSFLTWRSLESIFRALFLLMSQNRSYMMTGLTNARRIGAMIAAVFYVVAGSIHFIHPEPYIRIMPPYLPWHSQLVAISGFFEILGGLGLLFAPSRRTAAWGLVALLIAVFPANLFMAMNPVETGSASISPLLRWGRLPLQALLIWWVLWCSSFTAASSARSM
jgi:uncharacterized membrane protein